MSNQIESIAEEIYSFLIYTEKESLGKPTNKNPENIRGENLINFKILSKKVQSRKPIRFTRGALGGSDKGSFSFLSYSIDFISRSLEYSGAFESDILGCKILFVYNKNSTRKNFTQYLRYDYIVYLQKQWGFENIKKKKITLDVMINGALWEMPKNRLQELIGKS